MNMPLRLDGDCVQYGPETVLDRVTLEVKRGEFLAVVGPNGAGKTTLLRVILGLKRPDRGEVEVLGQPFHRISKIRPLLGYVPQVIQENLQIPLQVEDIVRMGRYPRLGFLRYEKEPDRKAVETAMERLQILPLRRNLYRTLSGGQKQRVLVARALAVEPELLILDEPTTGLDPAVSEGLYSILTHLHKETGITIIMVSHDVMALSERVTTVACLNRSLVVHGRPAEVLSNENMTKLYGPHYILFGHGNVPHMVVSRDYPNHRCDHG